MEPKLGKYRHYKGNEYEVIGIAKHSETHVELVVYRSCKDKNEIWVRPREMFIENVSINDQSIPRFKPVN